jgi:DNA (cytosine-5)-methyltransferase 1
MPLSLKDISSFFPNLLVEDYELNLEETLDDLVEKGYLRKKYPVKKKTMIKEGKKIERLVPNKDCDIGYELIIGALSLPFSKFLDPKDVAPTLVATTVNKLRVVDGKGVRPLSITEGLRISGFPDNFKMNVERKSAFGLIGNTIPVTVVENIFERLLKKWEEYK